MKKIAYILLLINLVGFAQRPARLMVLKDASILPYAPMDLSHCNGVDSTEIIIKYQLSYLQDKNSQTRYTDVIVLQVGRKITKCFGLKRYLINYSSTLLHSKQLPVFKHTEEYKKAGNGSVAYEIFMFRETDSLLYLHQMPAWFSKRIGYKEKIPKIDWRIGSACEAFSGYSCYNASGEYGGRMWRVTFTKDIPWSSGPWKLCGLPGLILYAEDSEHHFRFECIEIKQINEPINMYGISTDMTTKNKWLRMERAMHESPYSYFSNGGTTELTTKDGALDSSWTIPYNPIEVE